jgi:hypothetical protein
VKNIIVSLTTALLGLGLAASPATAATVVLYGNDFETPNRAIVNTCGNSLDATPINTLFGSADFVFNQQFTVEAVLLDDPAGLYSNPEGAGGNVAIGMLATVQDDKLALTFDAQSLPFVNVGLDLSAIDVQGCGGPFGVAVPILRISLLDSPAGAFDWGQQVLDQAEVSGVVPPDQWTFTWTNAVAGLDSSAATDGHISLVFDLIQSGYAAFDNLTITASTDEGVVDSDLDSAPDDTDNCPRFANLDQSNLDLDLAGDVCDPAPNDPAECGDINADGADDCALVEAGALDAGEISLADADLDAALSAEAGDAETTDATVTMDGSSGPAVDQLDGGAVDAGTTVSDGGGVLDASAGSKDGGSTDQGAAATCSCRLTGATVPLPQLVWVFGFALFAVVRRLKSPLP